MKILSAIAFDGSYEWSSQNAYLGVNFLFTTPKSRLESNLEFHEDSQCIIIGDSRLDYIEELKQDLGLNGIPKNKFPDSYLILKSYLKWGAECVNHLFGDFSFAIWDQESKVLFCARDHFGIRPFYYCDHNDFFVFSSDLRAIQEVPGISIRINPHYIVEALCTILPYKDLTGFSEVYKLEPSFSLIYSENSPLLKEKYWILKENKEFASLNLVDATLGLKERFINSIISKADFEYKTGVELSGGLDSSSIAKVLSRIAIETNDIIHAFTHSLSDSQALMEQKYIDAFAICTESFSSDKNILLNKITSSKDSNCVKPFYEYLYGRQKPVIQAFALLSDELYKEANRQGVKVLFSGYGADQVVTNKGNLYLMELVEKRNWAVLKSVLVEVCSNKGTSWRGQFIKLIIRGEFPKLHKIWRHLRFKRANIYNNRFKQITAKKSIRNQENLYEEFLNSVLVCDDKSVKDRQFRRIESGFVSDRLENSYYAAGKMGIEYRYPFLDVKLVEFHYSLKSSLKYGNGQGRFIFREAMKGILQNSIRLSNEKGGAAIPYVIHRLAKDENEIRSLIEEGSLNNSYHYVDYKRLHGILDRILNPRQKGGFAFIPRILFSGLSVIILQKWQREGKIDIGIKC